MADKPRVPRPSPTGAGDAEAARMATNLFRLFNFELFMKENKVVMVGGVWDVHMCTRLCVPPSL